MYAVRLVVIGILIMLSPSVFGKIIFSAPPREKPAVGEKYYGPIADALSDMLGEKVEYEHPKNWIQYARDMRAGKYDIVFDGPHFAAWRIKNVEHVAITRLKGNLRFYVLAKKDDVAVKGMLNLVGSGICGLASPNLGTVSVFELYKNPIVQPNVNIITGSMRKVMRKFLDGECRAAVVRDKLYNKLSQRQQEKIKIIAKSKKMPNQSITVSKRLNKSDRDKIQAFFLSQQGVDASTNLLNRFSKKKKTWIKTNSKPFRGLEDLLEGIVYGW